VLISEKRCERCWHSTATEFLSDDRVAWPIFSSDVAVRTSCVTTTSSSPRRLIAAIQARSACVCEPDVRRTNHRRLAPIFQAELVSPRDRPSGDTIAVMRRPSGLGAARPMSISLVAGYERRQHRRTRRFSNLLRTKGFQLLSSCAARSSTTAPIVEDPRYG